MPPACTLVLTFICFPSLVGSVERLALAQMIENLQPRTQYRGPAPLDTTENLAARGESPADGAGPGNAPRAHEKARRSGLSIGREDPGFLRSWREVLRPTCAAGR